MNASSPSLPSPPQTSTTTGPPSPAWWRRRIGLVLVLPLLTIVAPMVIRMTRSVPRSDVGTTKSSAGGKYRLRFAPEPSTVPLQQLHRWTIRAQSPDGRDAALDRIDVDGGMPQHGHGLPTQPRVTGRLPDGRFVVDGMKFSMPGWWELRLRVNGRAGLDSVTYNLTL